MQVRVIDQCIVLADEGELKSVGRQRLECHASVGSQTFVGSLDDGTYIYMVFFHNGCPEKACNGVLAHHTRGACQPVSHPGPNAQCTILEMQMLVT